VTLETGERLAMGKSIARVELSVILVLSPQETGRDSPQIITKRGGEFSGIKDDTYNLLVF
jgi:hypothetical protein